MYRITPLDDRLLYGQKAGHYYQTVTSPRSQPAKTNQAGKTLHKREPAAASMFLTTLNQYMYGTKESTCRNRARFLTAKTLTENQENVAQWHLQSQWRTVTWSVQLL